MGGLVMNWVTGEWVLMGAMLILVAVVIGLFALGYLLGLFLDWW